MKKKMRNQKLIGLLLILVSIVPMAIEHDATAALLFAPLGLYLMVAKRYWLTD